MTTPLYSFENLSYTFPEAVEPFFGDMALTLNSGEAVGLIGKSGSGKSTLLYLIGGLAKASSATFLWQAEPVQPTDVAWRAKHIGFLFQSFHLIDELTILENVLLPLQIAHLTGSSMTQKRDYAVELLESFGLKNLVHRQTRLLSGGEKQRVALIRAILHDPCLLLCDEPTGNLDDETSELLISYLLNWVVEKKERALLLVTHDLSLAKRCHRSLLLENGRLKPIEALDLD